MAQNVVILVRQEGLGQVAADDRAFGCQMFDLFLHTLEPRKVKPKAICFYTEGVRLVCKGSPAVPGLALLEGMGVQLIACKTCLDHYGLTEQVAVGKVGGMKDITAAMMEADAVLTI